MAKGTAVDSSGRTVHKLEDRWTLWLEKKDTTRQHQLTEKEWDSSLRKIGAFDTLEGYFMFYSKLKRPSELEKQMSYYLFRGDLKPTWENYSDGGHWTITLARNFDSQQLDRVWEQMSYALIGEEFNSPHLVGAVLSVKKDCCTLSIWSDQSKTKFSIGDTLRSVLNLGMNVFMEYKTQAESIKDATGRGGEAYVIKTPNIKAGDGAAPPKVDLASMTDADA
eukprot:TRINITY_DN30621_c0_g1_i1.p1 TRINITY_DN30621_c0_g1~~TRINITY_DN30621_c0_g1_i1.p1  ORF type:complete len:222 (+),score=95.17 TRINITY_DN30621_c0_g1_i1:51-716(+)